MAIWDGAFKWTVHMVQDAINGVASYFSPADNDEDDTTKKRYKTVVTYLPPLRETKCLFVSEMPDFYSDSELNKGYHTKKEYVDSLTRYGYIYKTQKFPNADSAAVLLSYATDWIKNNYHGGLTSFNITALDMNIAGNSDDFEKYTVGRRVNVIYPDPVTKRETQQTLTIISAEYDLQNPEKDNYKIGIPDVTLNKVYGETKSTKKGTKGGGGGKKKATDTSADDGTTLDDLTDGMDGTQRELDETDWAHLFKVMNGSDDPDIPSDYSSELLRIPSQKDPGAPFAYTLVSDFMKTGDFKATIGEFMTKLSSKYIVSKGAIEAKKVESDEGNITDVTSKTLTNEEKIATKDMEASNNVTVTNKTTTKDLEASGLIKGLGGEFSTMKINNKDFKVDIEDDNPVIWINDQKYILDFQRQ